MNSLANEVSAMESEIEGLRSENQVQRQHIGVLEFENEQLRKALAKVQAERDMHLRRAEGIKVLLDQTGASLVSGIQKFHDNERAVQEQQLGVGSKEDASPKFLTTAERTFG